MAVVCCWLMATTAEGTINPWVNNRHQQPFNRLFWARPSPSEDNFPFHSDYDGRLMEIPTETAGNGPEARAPGRFNRPSTFSPSGI